MNFKVLHLGDNSLLLNFSQEISESVLSEVIMMERALNHKNIQGVEEIASAYSSLAVFYDPMVITPEKLVQEIDKIDQQEFKNFQSNSWEIAVCYDSSLSQDLEKYLSLKNLTLKEFIDRHSGSRYQVYMRGFLPGFLYLGGLDESLFINRKSTPSKTVPAGSVAIGGKQTGIYSFPSPAGWYVIGRTPAKIFDINNPEVMSINTGDTIRFKQISLQEYDQIIKAGSEGALTKAVTK